MSDQTAVWRNEFLDVLASSEHRNFNIVIYHLQCEIIYYSAAREIYFSGTSEKHFQYFRISEIPFAFFSFIRNLGNVPFFYSLLLLVE